MSWKLCVTVHFGAFLAILWFQPSRGQWLNHIYIDPVKGEDNSSCLTPNNSSQPCQTLNYAFLYRNFSTQYVLSGRQHYLKRALPNGTQVAPFTQDGLAITGLGGNTTGALIECTEPNAGLAFVGVADILLQKVAFRNCGALRNSTSRNFHSPGFVLYQSYAVLYFYLCRNVNMSEVAVDYNFATGVVMYDTIGTNNVAFSSFSRNIVEKGSPYPGGGGFYIEFTYCIPGDDSCRDSVPSYVSANSDSTYNFDHCNFTGNQAQTLNDIDNSTYIIPNRTNHEAFGRGGGLSMFFKGNATSNSITVTQCWFELNQAQWGGGLFAEFHDSTSQNAVVIRGSTFLRNNCSFNLTSGTAGGGMRLGHYVYGRGEGLSSSGNTVLVDNCRFLENIALNGGGLSISPTLQNTTDSQLALIQVNRSHFERNRAKLGAAIHISRFTLILEGKLLKIQLIACNVSNNSVDYYNGHIYEAGIGAVYVSGVPVEFRKPTIFLSNYGSALGVVGAKVDFTDCTAAFQGNTGSRGGGIALLGSAWILINEATTMLFTNNVAISSGGAIYNAYTERENLQTYANCFIHHKNPFLLPDLWNASFYFYENRAGNKKNSIHSTSILPCAWAGGSGVNQNIDKIFSWKGWICADCLSMPLCSCKNQTTSDAGNIAFTHGSTVSTIPGQTFKLPLEIADDFGVNINDETVFTATSANNETALIDPAFTYVSGELIRVTGEEGKNFTLILNTAGNRVWYVNMTVQLEECPLGFYPSISSGNSGSSAKCECANLNSSAHALLFGGALKCNPTSISAILKNTYWIGVHNETAVAAHCPPGFCYADPKTVFHELPRSVSQLNLNICESMNRTGMLCGECKPGYGPAVNSETYECILCNSTSIAVNSVKYFLSVYLPLFILFTLIIVFNIRLTTGPANAFILYGQVIASTFDLGADGQIPLNLLSESDHLVKAYRVPYGILNLEFLESVIKPLCLGTKLKALDIIQLDYVVALFPLLMIILVIVFIKLKSCLRVNCCRLPRTWRGLNRQWRIGEGLTHAFAAFVLLSYTKFSLTSSYLVNTEPLVTVNGDYLKPYRVYYSGQYAANSPEYILKYYLPACIVFATFVAIPPLLLLDYPMKWFAACVRKVRCLRRLYPAVKVQILLDTFQGCYKNNMRFFAGLYLIFRLVINVSYIYTTLLGQYIVQQVVCTLFVVLLAICQPYSEEKKLFNYVDILIFSDLAVINALSLYLYAYSQNHPGLPPPHAAFVIQYVLVFLPLAYMVTYVTWYALKPCLLYLQPEARKLFTYCGTCFGRHDYRPLDDVAANTPPLTRTNSALQDDDDNHIEAMLKRAELENTYKPSPVNAIAEIPKLHGQNESSEDSGLQNQHSSSNNTSGSGKYGSVGHSTCSLSEPSESQTSEHQVTGSSKDTETA